MSTVAEPETPAVLSLPEAAKALGARASQIRTLYERGKLSLERRIGPYRVFLADDLPALRRALVAAGYLTEVQTEAK
jgi:hypothetical protein